MQEPSRGNSSTVPSLPPLGHSSCYAHNTLTSSATGSFPLSSVHMASTHNCSEKEASSPFYCGLLSPEPTNLGSGLLRPPSILQPLPPRLGKSRCFLQETFPIGLSHRILHPNSSVCSQSSKLSIQWLSSNRTDPCASFQPSKCLG